MRGEAAGGAARGWDGENTTVSLHGQKLPALHMGLGTCTATPSPPRSETSACGRKPSQTPPHDRRYFAGGSCPSIQSSGQEELSSPDLPGRSAQQQAPRGGEQEARRPQARPAIPSAWRGARQRVKLLIELAPPSRTQGHCGMEPRLRRGCRGPAGSCHRQPTPEEGRCAHGSQDSV